METTTTTTESNKVSSSTSSSSPSLMTDDVSSTSYYSTLSPSDVPPTSPETETTHISNNSSNSNNIDTSLHSDTLITSTTTSTLDHSLNNTVATSSTTEDDNDDQQLFKLAAPIVHGSNGDSVEGVDESFIDGMRLSKSKKLNKKKAELLQQALKASSLSRSSSSSNNDVIEVNLSSLDPSILLQMMDDTTTTTTTTSSTSNTAATSTTEEDQQSFKSNVAVHGSNIDSDEEEQLEYILLQQAAENDNKELDVAMEEEELIRVEEQRLANEQQQQQEEQLQQFRPNISSKNITSTNRATTSTPNHHMEFSPIKDYNNSSADVANSAVRNSVDTNHSATSMSVSSSSQSISLTHILENSTTTTTTGGGGAATCTTSGLYSGSVDSGSSESTSQQQQQQQMMSANDVDLSLLDISEIRPDDEMSQPNDNDEGGGGNDNNEKQDNDEYNDEPLDLNALPDTVTVLRSHLGHTIYLVGTSHFSKQSHRDVRRVIQTVQPAVVMLELCHSRICFLSMDEQEIIQQAKSLNISKLIDYIKKNGWVQGFIYALLLTVSSKVTKDLDMAPGGEFRNAYKEAVKIPNCTVVLGDRPMDITLRRAIAQLSTWQKIKMAFHCLFNNEKVEEEELEKYKQKDILEQQIGELAKEFPGLSKVIVHERDQYLAYSLWSVCQKFAPNPNVNIVGVVGIGHSSGIQAHWDNVDEIDVESLVQLPPNTPSKTFRVIKYSFYGLTTYAIYRYVLPGAVKHAVNQVVNQVATKIFPSFSN